MGSFENVNLYPWIAHMLGLQAPKNDGSLNVLAGTLRDNGRRDGQCRQVDTGVANDERSVGD